MANLTRLLGTLMASGLAGRSHRGGVFGRHGFGYRRRSGKLMAISALASLAYNAYQSHQARRRSGLAPEPESSRGEGGSLGERLAALLPGMGGVQAPEVEPEFDDARALLLIRAMITAANADGQISPDERQRIIAHVDAAELSSDERQVLEGELAQPRSLDEIVADVRDADTAEEVYLASRVAIEPGTPADRHYLHQLATRIGIDPNRRAELDAAG